MMRIGAMAAYSIAWRVICSCVRMIERRKHRRILTLKNFCWAFGVFAVVVIALSFDLFARRAAPGEYGRLVGTELPRHAPITPRPQVVTEAPVDDQTAAAPLLL